MLTGKLGGAEGSAANNALIFLPFGRIGYRCLFHPQVAALKGFSPAPEFPEIAEAQALLAAVA